MIVASLLLLLALWLGCTRVGRQSWSVTQVGLLTIPERLGSSLVVVIGIAGVVGVLVAVLAMGAGFEATLKETGTDDTAIVMRGGAQSELNSVLDHDSATLIAQLPQVAHNAAGLPLASPELVVVASLAKKSTGLDSNVEIRGVGERAWELRPEMRITAGRRFQPGLRELVVGKGARGQFANLDLGSSINLNGQRWNVVGAFESGDAYDSEIWADAAIVGPAYRRGSSVTSVTVRLTQPAALDAFKAALASDPRLKVDARTTRAYYTEQSASLSSFIRIARHHHRLDHGAGRRVRRTQLPCTRRWRRARAKSPRCARSAFAACRYRLGADRDHAAGGCSAACWAQVWHG